MTRRELFLSAAAWSFVAPKLFAQIKYPGVAYRDYSRCLPDYLRELAERAYQARNREIAKLTTPEAVRARQRWVTETFWKLAGGRPQKTPLNPRTTGSFERTGYRVEKIVYESRPGFHIPGNLYIPTRGKPKFPGVLFQMGHSLNGKAAAAYQKCCQGLAQLGFLVLAFDPMGQGERTYYPNSKGYLTRLPSADDEHTVPGKQMLLVGDTATRLQVWDAIRSLDYLAAHPMVDPKRLASTGQSGGGTLTMLLSAVDDRLAAAVSSSPNTENVACANFIPPGSTDDAEQNFLGSGPLGFDRWDLLYPLAPKPLLVLVSAKDFFGTYSPQYITNGWEEFQKLQKAYEALGHGDRVAWADTALPHTLSYDLRLRTYNWFLRWLKGESKPIKEEPPVAVEKDETLWVGRSGNMVRDFGSQTPFSLNRSHAAKVKTPDQPENVEELLGLERPQPTVKASVLGRAPSRHLDVEALEIPSAVKVWAPAWLFVPGKVDPAKPALIVLEPQGRNARWREGQLYQGLAAEGLFVCAADVRGVGDLSPEFSRGAPRYQRWHQQEENYAWSSLIFGRSLVGQRVTDLLAVVTALRAHEAVGQRRLVVAARGKMTVPALFAAVVDPEINSVYLAEGLVSYRSIVETEEYDYPFANFLPKVLLHTDLPQMAAAIAPRRVRLAGTVNAGGRKIDPARVRKIYAQAGNVEVLPEAQWDVGSLLQL
jgi:cephalosporin-C deacetylase-like acetyl esterase